MNAVTMHLLVTDGSTDWIYTAKGLLCWNFVDQTGDIELTNNNLNGPYVYVGLDDAGGDDIVTLDKGKLYTCCCKADVELTMINLTSPS